LTPRLEAADVFRQHKQEFLSRWGDSLSPQQRKAFRDICACRTAALGARWEQCDHCAHQFLLFHSCLMGSNSLWGVERGNRRKSNHSKPLFLPIKNLGLPKAAVPVGWIYPDRRPQMIRSRLVVKVAHEAVLA
jgi:hypothetical protein